MNKHIQMLLTLLKILLEGNDYPPNNNSKISLQILSFGAPHRQ